MKKIFLVAAIAGFAMASCKKNYVCECTTSGSQGGVTLENFPAGSYTIKNTKTKAKSDCKAKGETDGGFITTCEIK